MAKPFNGNSVADSHLPETKEKSSFSISFKNKFGDWVNYEVKIPSFWKVENEYPAPRRGISYTEYYKITGEDEGICVCIDSHNNFMDCLYNVPMWANAVEITEKEFLKNANILIEIFK